MYLFDLLNDFDTWPSWHSWPWPYIDWLRQTMANPLQSFQPLRTFQWPPAGKPSAKHHIHLDMDEAAFIDQPALRASGHFPCICEVWLLMPHCQAWPLKKKQSKWKVNPRCSVPILPKVIPNFQPSSFLSIFLGSHHSPPASSPHLSPPGRSCHGSSSRDQEHLEVVTSRQGWLWLAPWRPNCLSLGQQVETIQFYNTNTVINMDYKDYKIWIIQL